MPQLRELLRCANRFNHPVIEVRLGQKIKVKHLLYVSLDMWMVHNYLPYVKSEPEDFLFSPYVTSNLRECVFEKYPLTSNSKHLKIFLSRNSCLNQRLRNSDEIEALFRNSGFIIVYPEKLSFEEQVRMFQNADLIVGPTGAAFTNVVYCRENTCVGIIVSEIIDTMYCFSNIAYLVNVNLQILGADIVEKGIAESQDQFMLDLDKCRRFISLFCK